MIDICEFLLARIAEEKAKALEANGRVAWLTLREPDGSMRYTTVAHQLHEAPGWWVADGHNVDTLNVYVFYDSRQRLVECETKVAIVQRFVAFREGRGVPFGFWPEYEDGWLDALDYACKLLALPYADHPDYREEWRP